MFNPSDASDSHPARNAKRGWFKTYPCDLQAIREAADSVKFLPDVLAVFISICELADEGRSSTATCTRRRISEHSGVSLRQIDRVLALLTQAGVLVVKANFISGTKEHGPSSYTLRQPDATLRQPDARLRQDGKRVVGAVSTRLNQTDSNSVQTSPPDVAAGEPRGQNPNIFIPT